MPKSKNVVQFVKQNKYVLILLFLGFGLMIVAAVMMPVFDWGYPYPISNVENVFARSREEGWFSRVFDMLLVYFLTVFPKSYPFSSYIFIGLTHTGAGIFLYLIAKRSLALSDLKAFISSLLFMVSAVSLITIFDAAVLSTTLQMLFGAAGIYFTIRARLLPGKLTAYLGFSLLAMLTKESGVAFLVIIPLFEVVEYAFERISLQKCKWLCVCLYIPGMLVLGVYIVLMYFLKLQHNGIYNADITFNLIDFIKRFAFLLLYAVAPNVIVNANYSSASILLQFLLLLVLLFDLLFLYKKRRKNELENRATSIERKRLLVAVLLFLMACVSLGPFLPVWTRIYYAYLAVFFVSLLIGFCIPQEKRVFTLVLGLLYLGFSCFSSYIALDICRQVSKRDNRILAAVSGYAPTLPEKPKIAVVFSNPEGMNRESENVGMYYIGIPFNTLSFGMAFQYSLERNATIGNYFFVNHALASLGLGENAIYPEKNAEELKELAREKSIALSSKYDLVIWMNGPSNMTIFRGNSVQQYTFPSVMPRFLKEKEVSAS